MFKLVVLFALVACAMAAPKPGFLHSGTAYASAPIATSYANSVRVYEHSPVVATAPFAYAAAPALTYSVHPAHYSHYYAASPVAYGAHYH